MKRYNKRFLNPKKSITGWNLPLGDTRLSIKRRGKERTDVINEIPSLVKRVSMNEHQQAGTYGWPDKRYYHFRETVHCTSRLMEWDRWSEPHQKWMIRQVVVRNVVQMDPKRKLSLYGKRNEKSL